MLFAFWNLIRACLVFSPKYVDSYPSDPELPRVVDILNPLLLRNCCSNLTSDPLLPTSKSLGILATAWYIVLSVDVDDDPSRDTGGDAILLISNASDSIKFLVFSPKYPLAGVMLFAFWNLIRACFVRSPKYVDSYPIDPVFPGEEMVNPDSFRNFCNVLTSSPLLPVVRFLDELIKDLAVVAIIGDVILGEVVARVAGVVVDINVLADDPPLPLQPPPPPPGGVMTAGVSGAGGVYVVVKV